MAQEDARLILAMPVGLPGEGAAAAAPFAALRGRMEAAVTDRVLSVWTDPALPYSGICPMVRSAVSCLPDGGGTRTLHCQTWLWEYLKLRSSAGDGALPFLITFANLDEAAVRTDLTAELTGNPKYANLTSRERTDSVAALLAGNARLVADAGTPLGLGRVDTAHARGWRKVVISLYDADMNRLDPAFYVTLWETIGGEHVAGHPLISLVQGPVTPAIAPVEGGTRIKVTGAGLTAASTVTIGGRAASAVRVRPDGTGTALYATVPPGTAGKTDLVVDGATFAGAFAYTEDVAATARAAMASLVLHLGELTDQAGLLAAAGPLDDETRAGMRNALERAARHAGEAVEARSRCAGAPALDSAALSILSDSLPALESLIASALNAIG